MQQHIWCLVAAVGVVPANWAGKEMSNDCVSWLDIKEDEDLVQNFAVDTMRQRAMERVSYMGIS